MKDVKLIDLSAAAGRRPPTLSVNSWWADDGGLNRVCVLCTSIQDDFINVAMECGGREVRKLLHPVKIVEDLFIRVAECLLYFPSRSTKNACPTNMQPVSRSGGRVPLYESGRDRLCAALVIR